MLIGSLDAFTAGRVASDGYLKPNKRNLPDFFVTEPTLQRAAAILVKLATVFRRTGDRLIVACGEGRFARKELGEEAGRLKRSVFETNNWGPARPTLVFIEGTAIGLTIYEQIAEKEMVYIDGNYLPVREAKALKPGLWDRKTKTFYRPTTQRVGSKRLCLKAYSPYWGVEWDHTWVEERSSLTKQADEIVSALRDRAKTLAPQVLEAAHRAELQRKQWEVEQETWRIQHERSQILKARADAAQNLLQIIGKWSDDRKLQDFFEDITSRSSALTDEARTQLLQKVQEAKSLLATTDSIGALLSWEIPPPEPPD
jgi:hypothetical protein